MGETTSKTNLRAETKSTTESAKTHQAEKITERLGKTPSDIDLEKCVRKIRTGKAEGKDDFSVELLKYGEGL